jgi:hypothetical protein
MRSGQSTAAGLLLHLLQQPTLLHQPATCPSVLGAFPSSAATRACRQGSSAAAHPLCECWCLFRLVLFSRDAAWTLCVKLGVLAGGLLHRCYGYPYGCVELSLLCCNTAPTAYRISRNSLVHNLCGYVSAHWKSGFVLTVALKYMHNFTHCLADTTPTLTMP